MADIPVDLLAAVEDLSESEIEFMQMEAIECIEEQQSENRKLAIENRRLNSELAAADQRYADLKFHRDVLKEIATKNVRTVAELQRTISILLPLIPAPKNPTLGWELD